VAATVSGVGFSDMAATLMPNAIAALAVVGPAQMIGISGFGMRARKALAALGERKRTAPMSPLRAIETDLGSCETGEVV
jgi:hypothetical protein